MIGKKKKIAHNEKESSFFHSSIVVHLVFCVSTASNSNIKLKVEIDGVPLDQCNNVYRIQNVVLTPKQLCAGGVPGKDSCRYYFCAFIFCELYDFFEFRIPKIGATPADH